MEKQAAAGRMFDYFHQNLEETNDNDTEFNIDTLSEMSQEEEGMIIDEETTQAEEVRDNDDKNAPEPISNKKIEVHSLIEQSKEILDGNKHKASHQVPSSLLDSNAKKEDAVKPSPLSSQPQWTTPSRTKSS